MFFLNSFLSLNMYVNTSETIVSKSKTHSKVGGGRKRRGVQGLYLVERQRKDGIRQRYWIRPDQLRKTDKKLKFRTLSSLMKRRPRSDSSLEHSLNQKKNSSRKNRALREGKGRQIEPGTLIPQHLARKLQSDPELGYKEPEFYKRNKRKDEEVYETQEQERRKLNERDPEQQEGYGTKVTQRGVLSRIGNNEPKSYIDRDGKEQSLVLDQEFLRFQRILNSVRARSKKQRAIISGDISQKQEIAQHIDYEPKTQAREAVVALERYLQQYPEKVEQTLQRLRVFHEYFSRVLPTHTSTNFGGTAAIATGVLIPGRNTRIFAEDRKVYEEQAIRNRIQGFKLDELGKVYLQRMEEMEMRVASRLQALEDVHPSVINEAEKKRNELEKKELSRQLKTFRGGKVGNSIPDLFRRASLSNQAAREVLSTLQNRVSDFIIQTRQTTEQATGLDSDWDRRVHGDTKVYLALHSSSRYETLDPEGAITFVFPRSVAAEQGSTVSLVNLPQYAEAAAKREEKSNSKEVKTASLKTLPEELHYPPEEVARGRGLLKDVDDEDSIMALSLHAALHFDGLEDYLSQYREKTGKITEAPSIEKRPKKNASREELENYSAAEAKRLADNAVIKKALLAERTAEEILNTLTKPFQHSEVHYAGNLAVSKASFIIVKSRKQADSILAILPSDKKRQELRSQLIVQDEETVEYIDSKGTTRTRMKTRDEILQDLTDLAEETPYKAPKGFNFTDGKIIVET